MKLENLNRHAKMPRKKLGEIFETDHDRWLFVCTRCGKDFPLLMQFVAHVKLRHSRKHPPGIVKLNDLDPVGSKLLPMPSASDEEDAMGDESSDSRHTDDFSDADDEEDDNDDINLNSNAPTYECYICHMTFTKRIHCHNHVIEHSGYVYQCEYCMERFVRKGIAKYHRSKCGPANQYTCTWCPLKFANKAARKKHNHQCEAKVFRKQPDVTELYTCHQCVVTFTDQRHYMRHMQIHEVQLYRCDSCSYDTYVESNLAKHKLHCTTKCTICDKVLSSKTTFRTHMLQHANVRNFQCTVCGKQFVSKNGLEKHHVTHNGERKHTCDVCAMAFTRSDKLLRHRRLHANDHLRTCRFCGKYFRIKQALEIHALKVHKRPWDAPVDVNNTNKLLLLDTTSAKTDVNTSLEADKRPVASLAK